MKVQLALLQAVMMSMKRSVELDRWVACALALIPEWQEQEAG